MMQSSILFMDESMSYMFIVEILLLNILLLFENEPIEF
jgi:hypothetical protein